MRNENEGEHTRVDHGKRCCAVSNDCSTLSVDKRIYRGCTSEQRSG